MARPLIEVLSGLPMPGTLTIKDLKDLDNSELKAVIEAQIPVNLGDEAA